MNESSYLAIRRIGNSDIVADENDYTGTWGITMRREITVSGVPQFTCTISGNQVDIESEGTNELRVVMGEKGLQLSGEVVLNWNGSEVYRGEACDYLLSTEGSRKLTRMPGQGRGSLVGSILSKY